MPSYKQVRARRMAWRDYISGLIIKWKKEGNSETTVSVGVHIEELDKQTFNTAFNMGWNAHKKLMRKGAEGKEGK